MIPIVIGILGLVLALLPAEYLTTENEFLQTFFDNAKMIGISLVILAYLLYTRQIPEDVTSVATTISTDLPFTD
jgi:hypothetical protein